MNSGSESLKKAAVNKAKQLAHNGSGNKKRKQLNPIITTESQQGGGNPYNNNR